MSGTRAKRKAYRAYLRSAVWAEKRAAVLFRDGGQCRRCGSRWQLEVHHLSYARFGGRERLADLITLCEGCHAALHAHPATQRSNPLWHNTTNVKTAPPAP